MIKEEQYLLTSQEILGGLRSAIERGELLKEAMMTFYRAGYDKNEIEEAARVYLEMNKDVEKNPLKKSPEEKEKKGEVKKEEKETIPIMPKTQEFQTLEKKEEKKKKVVQKVSKYDSNKKVLPAGRIVTIVLILILVLLFGILGAVILFKSELVSFFNNLFN
jgi:tetrahydromethanopterin S-methyltransferase subunit A